MLTKYNIASWIVLVLGGLLVGSCNSNATADADATAYIPKSDTVVIEQMVFSPAELTVHKGDTIIFINRDLVAHDITQKEENWASPTLSMDDSWSKIANESFDYFCSIHVVMAGKVVVKD